ncbi:MAG TPA: four helix bundle protein [Flavipsychrobacter sp.]|nr:four helix bundle protein [Flavipsychrobacter sp.]
MNEKLSNQDFTQLAVWQAGRSFKLEIELLVKRFPSEEKFRMTDQILRSVRSINHNISEGHGRFTYKDQLHFCVQARGSLSETYNHLLDAFDSGFITESELNHFKQQHIDHVGKLLNGYITFLRNSINRNAKSTNQPIN